MNTLYTFGYAGVVLSDFARATKAREWLVIDTRMLPRSRRAEWNKKSLQQTLDEQYAHVQELGNVNYKSGSEIKLADEALGIKIIVDLLKFRDVLLLCGCKEVDECHRKYIAELVQQQTGCAVVHLTPDDLRHAQKVRGEPLELKSQTVSEPKPKPQTQEMFSAAEVTQPAPMSSIWGDKRPPLVLISETVPVDRDEDIQPKLL